MRYVVHWDPNATYALTALWVRFSGDRAAITAASHQIDQKLETDPKTGSRHMSEGLYSLEVMPLRAYFEINDATLTVSVTNVIRC